MLPSSSHESVPLGPRLHSSIELSPRLPEGWTQEVSRAGLLLPGWSVGRELSVWGTGLCASSGAYYMRLKIAALQERMGGGRITSTFLFLPRNGL